MLVDDGFDSAADAEAENGFAGGVIRIGELPYLNVDIVIEYNVSVLLQSYGEGVLSVCDIL